MRLPARVREAAEPVPRPLRASDPPACRRSVRQIGAGRTQDEQERCGCLGGALQATSLFQGQAGIEEARHGSEPLRPQGLFQGEMGLVVAAHLEQQDAPGIEPEPGKPVAVRRRMPRCDDEERLASRLREMPGDERQGEAEGGRLVALGQGRDLVEQAEAEAAARQSVVEAGDAERHDGAGIAPCPGRRHEHPQAGECGRAVRSRVVLIQLRIL
ncbi:hypothetical protein AEGHOMDF_3734 [Methylobacterium soli]|nr:hypothetical protein AEGHOMDF_3734 [Methylobacterium soli]